VRTLTFTKSYTNSKGVQSFTTSTTLTSTNSSTRDGSALTGRDRSNSSSNGNLRMRATSNTSDMSGYASDTSGGLRKRSASIDQVLTSNPAAPDADAAVTTTVSEMSAPADEVAAQLPSQHHPMRVIGCIDGDGLGLLSWW
jgi:hypothetical protein